MRWHGVGYAWLGCNSWQLFERFDLSRCILMYLKFMTYYVWCVLMRLICFDVFWYILVFFNVFWFFWCVLMCFLFKRIVLCLMTAFFVCSGKSYRCEAHRKRKSKNVRLLSLCPLTVLRSLLSRYLTIDIPHAVSLPLSRILFPSFSLSLFLLRSLLTRSLPGSLALARLMCPDVFDVFWCVLMCSDVFWCVLMCFDVNVICVM